MYKILKKKSTFFSFAVLICLATIFSCDAFSQSRSLTNAATQKATSQIPTTNLELLGMKRVYVHVESQEQRDFLLALPKVSTGDHDGVSGEYIVTPEVFNLLVAMGIQCEVLDEDIGQTILTEQELQLRTLPEEFADEEWYEAYRTATEIEARIQAWATDPAFSGILSVETIGSSVEGRNISSVWLGKGSGKPAVFFMGGMHAGEWSGSMTAMYITEQLLKGYGSDSRITNLLDAVQVVTVPMVNPDGNLWSHNVFRFWRKNRRPWSGSSTSPTCIGVDLNRNWDVSGWETGGECTHNYMGPTPFSEPESQAVRNLVQGLPELKAFIDYHCCGKLLLHPYAYTSQPADDLPIFLSVGSRMRQAISPTYTVDSSFNTWGTQNVGVSRDWAYDDQGLISFTIELPSFGESSPGRIIEVGDDNFDGILSLMGWAAGDPPPSCILDLKFTAAPLTEGEKYYTDRVYTLTNVPPQYRGMEMIKTPNDERNNQEIIDYINVTLPPNISTVFIAYDSRAVSLPDWLNPSLTTFTNTGTNIETSLGTQPFLNIFKKTYAPGSCVALGANKAVGFSGETVSNYIVFYGLYSENQEPDGSIETPIGNQTITVGDPVNFSGIGTDPDNNVPLTHLWDFGDPMILNSTSDAPGLISFNNTGVFNVTLTVKDSLGLADSTPATVKITVNSDPSCSLDPKFEQTTLNKGIEYYTDRNYTLTNVPAQYIGLEMIKAPNDERNNTCGSGYIRFVNSADSIVYVGYDQRATALPDWLSGFTDTGEIINTSLGTQGWLKVYSKQFTANECVDFGCNKGTGFTGGTVSNYCVFYGTGTPVSCILEEPKFQKTTVQNGMTYYTDRSYTFTSVPSQYVGLDMVKAPNNDRDMNCASGYMSFVIPVDGTVYVGYDRRATTLPEWLSGFTDTGEIINTSLGTQGWLKVYSKQFTANECVDFGCNKGTGFTGGTVSNYCVFYGTGTPVSCILEEPKFQKTTVQNGMTYYTDRSYTFTSVPSQYVGLEMVKAPNDERNNTCGSGYIRFVNSANSLVYVGYDQRATTLPAWLNGFIDTGEIINTSLGTQGWLKVYSKQFAANECVDLGCNKGTGFTGGTVSNYCVFYGTGTPVSCILEEPKFQKTTVQNGMTYYTDRSYTFTSVPSQYVGLDMIKAPNNERNNTCGSGYMSFVKSADGIVYVGYDQRATTLPDWLSGFTDTGEIINTSLGAQGWLKVYSKQFTTNECVDLGCNKGTGFAGGTVSNYVVFID